MPIYAPTLPPRPASGEGMHPALVILRFDLRRILTQKLGRFFGFAFVAILLVQVGHLYVTHLLRSQAALAGIKDAAAAFLPQGAAFQAQLLNPLAIAILWLQAAMVGGGLVARDTLYRVRPLIYAHPVTHADYLGAKFMAAAGIPLAIQLPFILLPWGLSLAVAGASGPVWPTAPLLLLPAAMATALLMGAVSLGASSLAGSPRAGFGWGLGILMGSGAAGQILAGTLGDTRWTALSVAALAKAWPLLMCGVPSRTTPGLTLTVVGTLCHIALWTWIAARRSRPGEATL